jgi:hypothetical protein
MLLGIPTPPSPFQPPPQVPGIQVQTLNSRIFSALSGRVNEKHPKLIEIPITN